MAARVEGNYCTDLLDQGLGRRVWTIGWPGDGGFAEVCLENERCNGVDVSKVCVKCD